MYASSLETAERGGSAQESPGPVKQPACAQSHRHGQVAGHLRLSGALNLLLEYPRGLIGALRRCVDYIVDVFSLQYMNLICRDLPPPPPPTPGRHTVSNSVQILHVKLLSLSRVLSHSCPVFLLPLLLLPPPPLLLYLGFFSPSYKKMPFTTNLVLILIFDLVLTLGFFFPP